MPSANQHRKQHNSQKRRRVVIVGSINIDMIVNVDRLPEPGETMPGYNPIYLPGGKGANQAVAAKRMGADCVMVGKIGNDPYGGIMQRFLQDEGIDVSRLSITSQTPTGTAVVMVTPTGENAIIVVLGANHQLTAADLTDLRLTDRDILLLQCETPAAVIATALQQAQSAHAFSILNVAPFIEEAHELSRQARCLIANRNELAALSGTPTANLQTTQDIRAAADSIRVPGQTLIVTLGQDGVLGISDDGIFQVAGLKGQAVDTTGAGDCFVGALAAAMAEEMALGEAIVFANIAAGISIERRGAAASFPLRSEVEAYRQTNEI